MNSRQVMFILYDKKLTTILSHNLVMVEKSQEFYYIFHFAMHLEEGFIPFV